MIPYVISTFFTIIMMYFATKQRNVNYFFALLAIIPPAMIAGFRDYSIGTDTLAYVIPRFNQIATLRSFEMLINTISKDIGYYYVDYIISRFTKDPHIYLFIVHFSMYTIVFIALHSISKKILWFGWVIYMLCFFNQSLNIARQSLALALSILAFSMLLKGNYKKSLIVTILLLTFHNSAFIFLIIFLIVYMTDKYYTLLDKTWVKCMAVGSVIGCLIMFSLFMNVLIDYNIVNEVYEDRYGEGDAYGTNMPISLVAFYSFNLVLFYWIKRTVKNRKYKTPLYKRLNSRNSLLHFNDAKILTIFEYIIIICWMTFFAGLISKYLVRIGFYFSYMICLMIPILLYYYNRNRLKRIAAMFFYIFYWIMITTSGLGGILPYTSKLLGI